MRRPGRTRNGFARRRETEERGHTKNKNGVPSGQDDTRVNPSQRREKNVPRPNCTGLEGYEEKKVKSPKKRSEPENWPGLAWGEMQKEGMLCHSGQTGLGVLFRAEGASWNASGGRSREASTCKRSIILRCTGRSGRREGGSRVRVSFYHRYWTRYQSEYNDILNSICNGNPRRFHS